jgi:hypothetical protein
LIVRALGEGNPARAVGQSIREGSPKAFWFVSAMALFIGTMQGMLQVVPATASLLVVSQEIPNIHAQLNMIGGIMLALMGVVYVLVPELTGASATQRQRRVSLYGIGGGIAGYYVVVLASGLMRAEYLREGMNDAQAAAQLGWVAPALMLLTAVPIFLGYCAFGSAMWQVTRRARAEWMVRWRENIGTYTGPLPPRVAKMPLVVILLIEGIGALMGFPGLGWLFAGQAILGVALLCLGPAVAWALIPLLTSPFADTVFEPYGITVLYAWLIGTAVLSSLLLALYVSFKRAVAREPKQARTPEPAPASIPSPVRPTE